MPILPNRVLRDLPGVAEIEAILRRVSQKQNYKWTDEWFEAEKLVDRVGKRLFGLTVADTEWRPELADNGLEDPFCDWEYYFHNYSRLDPRGQATRWDLAELDWDVLDNEGNVLLCEELFHRLLVCVAQQLAGHEFGVEPTEAELADDAENWVAALVERDRQRKRS